MSLTWTLSAFTDEAGESTDEQIAAARRGGLTHLDLRMVDGHNITTLPLDLAQTVAKKLQAAGLKVNMYGSPIGKIDIADDVKIDLDKLDHLAKLSDIFGCKAVRIFSYYNKGGMAHDQWRSQAIDRLKQLCERANQHGLILYHENESHIFGDKSDDVLALAELRDSRTFKLIYDFANYIRTGEPGWDTWRKCKTITDCFHFKDQLADKQHVPMGHGDTDSRRILADAAKAGWQGPCVLEPHLTHSDAVVATHTSGTSGSKALKDLDKKDTFQVAVEAARKLMTEVGATIA